VLTVAPLLDAEEPLLSAPLVTAPLVVPEEPLLRLEVPGVTVPLLPLLLVDVPTLPLLREPVVLREVVPTLPLLRVVVVLREGLLTLPLLRVELLTLLLPREELLLIVPPCALELVDELTPEERVELPDERETLPEERVELLEEPLLRVELLPRVELPPRVCASRLAADKARAAAAKNANVILQLIFMARSIKLLYLLDANRIKMLRISDYFFP
jgi:hypothetical protein